jgi:hypothetical protein
MRNATVVRWARFAFITGLIQVTSSHVFADVDAQTQQAIEKAETFLGTRRNGEYILSFVHFGATYRNHTLTEVRRVVDRNGRDVPGEFALVYRFDWDAGGAGYTDLAILCDRDGDVAGVQVLRTNAIFQQPFAIADATIQVVGAIVLDAFSDQMTNEDKRVVERMIPNSDSKSLLVVGLSMRQSVGLR